MSYDQSKLIFTLKSLPLDLLKIDGGTQSRLKIDEEYIDEIYENMKEGRLYPPVTVYFDGK